MNAPHRFTPSFRITNRMTAGLTHIERARGFLEAASRIWSHTPEALPVESRQVMSVCAMFAPLFAPHPRRNSRHSCTTACASGRRHSRMTLISKIEWEYDLVEKPFCQQLFVTIDPHTSLTLPRAPTPPPGAPRGHR